MGSDPAYRALLAVNRPLARTSFEGDVLERDTSDDQRANETGGFRGHRSERARQQQIDELCREKLNDGYGRASPKGMAQRECEALPKLPADAAPAGSTASVAAASTFRLRGRNSRLLPCVGRASARHLRLNGRPSKPRTYSSHRRIQRANFDNTLRWQILQGLAAE